MISFRVLCFLKDNRVDESGSQYHLAVAGGSNSSISKSPPMTLCITHPLLRDGTDFIALLFHSLYKTLVYESDRTNTTLLHIHVEALGRVVAENPADSLIE